MAFNMVHEALIGLLSSASETTTAQRVADDYAHLRDEQ